MTSVLAKCDDQSMADLPPPLGDFQLQSDSAVVRRWLPMGGDKDPVDLSAPYQRGSVWTVEQRRNLIKSILLRLPMARAASYVGPDDSIALGA